MSATSLAFPFPGLGTGTSQPAELPSTLWPGTNDEAKTDQPEANASAERTECRKPLRPVSVEHGQYEQRHGECQAPTIVLAGPPIPPGQPLESELLGLAPRLESEFLGLELFLGAARVGTDHTEPEELG